MKRIKSTDGMGKEGDTNARAAHGSSGGEYFVDRILDDADLQELDDLAASSMTLRRLDAATLYDESRKSSMRKSRVAWFGLRNHRRDPDCVPVSSAIEAKLRSHVDRALEYFGPEKCPITVDASGRRRTSYEPMQYAVYEKGCHYAAWHTDGDVEETVPADRRCLSVVILLSDPDDFEGGAFEVQRGDSTRGRRVPLARGEAITFPSKTLIHRVSPVRSGIRRSLVLWVRRR